MWSAAPTPPAGRPSRQVLGAAGGGVRAEARKRIPSSASPEEGQEKPILNVSVARAPGGGARPVGGPHGVDPNHAGRFGVRLCRPSAQLRTYLTLSVHRLIRETG